MDLYQRSIEIILHNQSASGAYIASPSFPEYAFSWLRDGSFIAHAMDRIGEHQSAQAFFLWVAEAVRRRSAKVERVLEKLDRGEPTGEDDYLHTRFTLEGEEAEGHWGNFQLDGYGTWLWALARHIAMTGDADLLRNVEEGVRLTARYLSALWPSPNYDCWEENPEDLHTYTLAAVFAGLGAVDELQSVAGESFGAIDRGPVAEEIRQFVLSRAVRDGCLVKRLPPQAATGKEPPPAVDANLLGVCTPYRLLAPDHPVMQRTLARIEVDLHHPDGGVYRYLADTYYGGGEWLLLTGWLGWAFVEAGEPERARALLRWIEAQADAGGHLPEQVSDHVLFPQYVPLWEEKWGPIAKPLLWSHAMYIILCDELGMGGR